jgi:RHS repeat-associated protein
LTDKLGSVRENTDGNGNVLDSITYDTYGNILAETHPTSGDRFKYTSREWDSEIGQYFYRARYYGPTIGRFINEDPIGFKGGDSNLFRYVKNSPVNVFDPRGNTLTPLPPFNPRGNTLTPLPPFNPPPRPRPAPQIPPFLEPMCQRIADEMDYLLYEIITLQQLLPLIQNPVIAAVLNQIDYLMSKLTALGILLDWCEAGLLPLVINPIPGAPAFPLTPLPVFPAFPTPYVPNPRPRPSGGAKPVPRPGFRTPPDWIV